MTSQIAELAGYFANPIRLTRIEVEIPQNSLANYSSSYLRDTGVIFPILPNDCVYIIPTGGDKWGREMRIYFFSINDASIPASIQPYVTSSGRQGYAQYNKRLNRNAIIDELLQCGFLIGATQNEARIRTFITPSFVSDFNRGYAIP